MKFLVVILALCLASCGADRSYNEANLVNVLIKEQSHFGVEINVIAGVNTDEMVLGYDLMHAFTRAGWASRVNIIPDPEWDPREKGLFIAYKVNTEPSVKALALVRILKQAGFSPRMMPHHGLMDNEVRVVIGRMPWRN